MWDDFWFYGVYKLDMMHWVAQGNSGRYNFWSAVRYSLGITKGDWDFSKFQRYEMAR
jgi:hypothetical protein